MTPLDLHLALNPSSAASAASGLKMLDGLGGGYTGAVNIGSDSANWHQTVMRDIAMGVAFAVAIKYLWGKIK